MKSYNYFCSTQIEVGTGKAKELPEMLKSLNIGSSILIVSDPGVVRTGLVSPIITALEASGYRVL
jgi:alcohol dehydrogenase class IV